MSVLMAAPRFSVALRTDENPLFDERAALAGKVRITDSKARFSISLGFSSGGSSSSMAGLRGLPEHKLHPHTLKHSVAMRAIKKTGIENVRQYGHKSIASTGEYLKVSDQEATAAVQAVL